MGKSNNGGKKGGRSGNTASRNDGGDGEHLTQRPLAAVKDMFAVKSIASGADLDTRLGRSIDTSQCEKGMRFKDGTVLAFPDPGPFHMSRGSRHPLRHGWMSPDEELEHQIKVPVGSSKETRACLYFTTETGAVDGFVTVGPAPDDMIDPPCVDAEIVG